MSTMDPRLDVLPKAQRLLWPSLRAVTDLGFLLYGGTAVALQLGHRTSVDFDFFTAAPVNPLSMPKRLPALLSGATTLQSERNTLTVSAAVPGHPDSVKLSFFGEIPWALAGRARLTRDGVLRVASLDDLMATKLAVLLMRVEVKDYLDIAAMLSAGVQLASGLARAREMYGSTFQAAESLKAMVYFKEGDFAALTASNRSTLINAARSIGSSNSTRQTPTPGLKPPKPSGRGR